MVGRRQRVSLSPFLSCVGASGGLNANALHRLICLTTWYLVGGTVLGRIGRCGFVGGGVSLGVGFEVSKVHMIPSFSHSASCLCGGCKISVIALAGCYVPHRDGHGSSSETVSKPLIRCLFKKLLIMVPFQSNRTVTRQAPTAKTSSHSGLDLKLSQNKPFLPFPPH